MSEVDYGAHYGTEFVCSKQFDHMVADPEHWTIGSLDTAVRVAKARSGLDPDSAHVPALFIDNLDSEWREPFWERQVGRVFAGKERNRAV